MLQVLGELSQHVSYLSIRHVSLHQTKESHRLDVSHQSCLWEVSSFCQYGCPPGCKIML